MMMYTAVWLRCHKACSIHWFFSNISSDDSELTAQSLSEKEYIKRPLIQKFQQLWTIRSSHSIFAVAPPRERLSMGLGAFGENSSASNLNVEGAIAGPGRPLQAAQ